MNTGFQLAQLQRIDSELENACKRIQEIELIIGGSVLVDKAREAWEISQVKLAQLNNDFTHLDTEIQHKRTKKAQSESSLYDGKIRNPKELQDLQLEITSINKVLSELDDQLLQQLTLIETTDNELQLLKQEYNNAVSKYETEKSRLVAEMESLENTVRNLHIKRTSQVGQISARALETYENLIKSKKGFAVAQLQEDSCSACGANLTPNQCQQVRSSSQLFVCPTCGRIVYGS